MIKSAIATAVVAATTATTVADVKVYGRIRVAAICTDAGDSECALEDRSSRFGIKASSEITDGLTAFGRYEFRVNAERASLQSAAGAGGQRLSYVGLKGGFGEISLGTRWSPYYLATVSYNDPTNAFGGTWNSGAGFVTSSSAWAFDFRNTHTLNYKNKFGAANIGVQVQMLPGTDEEIDEVSIGASFKVGAATIGLGYLDTDGVGSVAAIHARSKFGPVSVAGRIESGDGEAGTADQEALALALGYGFGGGKSLTLTYGQTDIDNGPTPTEIALEYTHNMGAGMKWFAGASVADDDVSGTDDVTRYGAGFRYDF